MRFNENRGFKNRGGGNFRGNEKNKLGFISEKSSSLGVNI